MSKLMRLAKRGADKEVGAGLGLSVGFKVKEKAVYVHIGGHYILLDGADLEFLVKRLPAAKERLIEALKEAASHASK